MRKIWLVSFILFSVYFLSGCESKTKKLAASLMIQAKAEVLVAEKYANTEESLEMLKDVRFSITKAEVAFTVRDYIGAKSFSEDAIAKSKIIIKKEKQNG
jgi:hypothetical protein